MFDAGMSHCDVTKQDVRNADAIIGSYILSLGGKTHERASTQPFAMLSPRVTQVQRILAVDFLFIKTDAARNLRKEFVDCVRATVSDTDNIMRSRTQGLIALLSTGNLNSSVKMWCLATNATIIRDQIKILLMPDLVVSHITSLAESQGHALHRTRC